jgi:uncharacterized protein (DUF305 family)
VSRRLAVLLVVLLAACSSGGRDADDVAFLQDMADHHEQAVRMALLIQAKGDVSPITMSFANDVVAAQRYELGLIDAYLSESGDERGSPNRDVMGWMGMHPVPLAEMPGMASRAALDELAKASGAAADELFFRLMVEHHRGGLHMARYAQEHGDDERVRDLATRIVNAQTKEIGEMERAMHQLGYLPN